MDAADPMSQPRNHVPARLGGTEGYSCVAPDATGAARKPGRVSAARARSLRDATSNAAERRHDSSRQFQPPSTPDGRRATGSLVGKRSDRYDRTPGPTLDQEPENQLAEVRRYVVSWPSLVAEGLEIFLCHDGNNPRVAVNRILTAWRWSIPPSSPKRPVLRYG